MSAKSKSSSGKASRRRFSSEVLAEARRVAAEYQVILCCEDGHWYGRGLELPHVFGDGSTPSACLENVRDALTGAVAYIIEKGLRPPAPAREGTRTEQVNVRLTAEEKIRLETSARAKGYKGLSDFIRAAALESTVSLEGPR